MLELSDEDLPVMAVNSGVPVMRRASRYRFIRPEKRDAEINISRHLAHSMYPDGNCVQCGKPQDHVHHMDGNPLNNDLGNLAPLCASCHRKAHGGVKAGGTPKPIKIRKPKAERPKVAPPSYPVQSITYQARPGAVKYF